MMKLSSFILCQSAKMRPDGTFDVVMGGLSEAVLPAFPAKLTVSSVLVMEADPGESGRQEVEVNLRDANARRLETWRYKFELASGQKGAHLVLNLKESLLPAPGEYIFDVRVNGKLMGTSKTLQAKLK